MTEPTIRPLRRSTRRNSSNKVAESTPTRQRTRRSVVQPIIIIESDEEEQNDQNYRNAKVFSNIKNKSMATPKKTNKTQKDKVIEEQDYSDGENFKEPFKTTPCSSPLKANISPRKKKSIDDGFYSNGSVTPPKQKKRNENNENFLFSPTKLFEKLDLNAKSPVKVVQTSRNIYQSARKALHSTLPEEMPGREKEHEFLRRFIKDHLKNQTSGSMYVSGPPGTGKTASLSKILQESDIKSQFQEVYINCTAIKSSAAIYAKIVSELNIKSSSKTEKDSIAAIDKYLSGDHKMILLVLDEIDQLESKKQSVLYTIFEWPAKEDSKIILVGIANALDLTDRILPRLRANCRLKPELMHFAAYTKEQIIDIFTHRLKCSGVLDLFHPAAVQMLAAKVAAVSGDVRRALDIGRRVIEIAEEHKESGKLLQSVENILSDKAEVKNVELKHVVNVLNTVYGTTNNFDDDGEDTFPLQQKIIVCSLLLILKKARNKDVTIGKLHEVYKKVCANKNIQHVDQSEFAGLCSLIETKGIIKVVRRKETRLHKVNLEWDEEEVSCVLKDKPLLSTILQDVSVLGKM